MKKTLDIALFTPNNCNVKTQMTQQTRVVLVRIPANLHERVWDRVLRPRNGRPRKSFQSILFEPVCAALRAASGDEPEPVRTGGERGTRRCRAGSPEEPAPDQARKGRGRGRNGGRGVRPHSAPPTS